MRSGCHTEIATASMKPRNGEPKIMRLPRAFGSRNDDSCFCHCEQSEAIYKPLIINAKTENKKNSPFANKQNLTQKQKTKKIHHHPPRHIIASEAKQSTTIIYSPFCHCEEQCDEAIHNH